ncbi:hypothetical protein OESDEN_13655 [Oesophagostomum dentatum]|uniref:Uncharacterized protein n=1 Tax=Oesophagostomum dentatum TaxID=61180 RepID=A0A0B1SMN8_OESDE|nr:hypothetical protein OESDEN_13655 [Oesophagostomum dentatum]
MLMGGALTATKKKMSPIWRSIRRKKAGGGSTVKFKALRYDVHSFTVDELCLLMKKHDPEGACENIRYQDCGYVNVIPAEKIFQKSAPSTGSFEQIKLQRRVHHQRRPPRKARRNSAFC